MSGETVLPIGGWLNMIGGKIVGINLIIEGSDGNYRIEGDATYIPQPIEPEPITAPPMTLYSQRDERWRYIEYAPGYTLGGSGCYITCVAMIASLAGSVEEPPQVANELRRVGCFGEADPELLTHPEKIPDAYPLLGFYGWYDWHKTQADKNLFFDELRKGPVITEVDFRPTTQKFNQHFVVALEWNEEKNDVLIADPWDGTKCYLLERYRLVWYSLGVTKPFESAICGMRLLRPKE
jgi:hypothetical protein